MFCAACSIILLIGAMLSANVSAARRRNAIRGHHFTPLRLPMPMQGCRPCFMVWACPERGASLRAARILHLVTRSSPETSGSIPGRIDGMRRLGRPPARLCKLANPCRTPAGAFLRKIDDHRSSTRRDSRSGGRDPFSSRLQYCPAARNSRRT